MTLLRAELRKSGDDIVRDLGFQVTLRRLVDMGYDLTTGQNMNSEQTFVVWGTYSRFRDKEVDDQSVLATDRKLFVSAQYEQPQVGDFVEGNGGVGRVVAVYRSLAEDTNDVLRMCVVR